MMVKKWKNGVVWGICYVIFGLNCCLSFKTIFWELDFVFVIGFGDWGGGCWGSNLRIPTESAWNKASDSAVLWSLLPEPDFCRSANSALMALVNSSVSKIRLSGNTEKIDQKNFFQKGTNFELDRLFIDCFVLIYFPLFFIINDQKMTYFRIEEEEFF